MDKIALVDCDDCVVDWIGGFAAFCTSLGLKLNGHRPSTWEMAAWLGVSDERCVELIQQFNGDAERFSRLPATAHADQWLPDLAKRGYSFVAITCCLDNDDIKAARKQNLKALFGDIFQDVHCLPLGADKTPYLARYEPTFWVEDNVKNARAGLAVGHTPLVIRQAHNRAAEAACDGSLSWFDNWTQLHPRLIAA